MNPAFKKYIAFFSLSFSLLIPCLTKACGPSLYLNEGRFSLFRNGLDGADGLEPFYYSETFLNSFEPDPMEKDYQRNCEEWRKYCGNKVSVEDIFAMQYKTDADTFLRDLSNNDWSRYKKNSYWNWLKLPNHAEALQYFILSKKIEFTQFGDKDPWKEGRSVQTGSILQYAKTATILATQTKDKFLRERYAFQALKMEYYGNGSSPVPDFEVSALPLYKKYLLHSKSVVAGWAALFYGLRQEDNNKRTLYLLKAFDLSEEKKIFCYLNISLTSLNALQNVNKDKKVTELIYTLKAMKTFGPAFSKIQELYAINPNSKYLPLLISREINKMEDWIWSPEFLNFSSTGLNDNGKPERAPYYRDSWQQYNISNYYVKKNHENDLKYLRNVRNFLSHINIKNNRSFLQLATAHLYNMTKNYDSALLCLNRITDFKDKKIETQKLIEWTIASAYTHNVRDPKFENKLATTLNRLISINPEFYTKDTQSNNYSDYEDYYAPDIDQSEKKDDLGELLLMLSNRFREQGDLLTAGLLYHKADIQSNIYDGDRYGSVIYNDIAYFDRNATPATIDSLLRFIHKTDKSAFEQLIKPKAWAPDDFYKDVKGTILIRQQKFHEALQVFTAMDQNFWRDNYAYKENLPKTTITSLGTLTPWESQTPATYRMCNKKEIVRDITQIQDSLKMSTLSTAQKAALHYRLGNCYYNITYFGKAWMMESYGKTSREERDDKGNYAYYSFYPNNIRYGRNYYGCAAAIKEYQTALQLSTEKEMKARCLLNLTLCDNSSFYTRNRKKISPYLQKVQYYYPKSDAYSIALTECPDINTTN